MLVSAIAASFLLAQSSSASCTSGRHARVRSAAADLSASIAAGCRGSATFRRVVSKIDGSSDVVYIGWARSGTLPRQVEAALLSRVTPLPDGTRYLWIAVRRGLTGAYLTSVIAHELQHALEVVEAPAVRSAAAIEARFAREQHGHGARIFETDAAVRIGETVYEELRRALKEVR